MPDFEELPNVAEVTEEEEDNQAIKPLPPGQPRKTVNDWLRDMRMSASVNKTTMGVETERVTPDLMLAASRKLLDINRRKADPDAKDSLEFQRIYGPTDFFAEHVLRDAGRLGRQLLWKATNKGNVDFMPTGALDQHVSDVFNSSKLTNMVDASSPLEPVEASFKISRVGEGGLGSMESAPDEMRLVQPSFLGFIDPVESPESLKVGLDNYMTKHCMKGSDGKLYQKFINAHTGKEELVDSVTAAKSIVTTPDMLQAKTDHVYAVGGRSGVRIVKKSDVDYYLPRMDDAFTNAANLVPGLSSVKELRLRMGCLHPYTSVLTINKRNEIDIVPAKDVNKSSYSLPGATNKGTSVCYPISMTVAKLPENRAWFKKVVLYSGRTLITSRDHRWSILYKETRTSPEYSVKLVTADRLRPGDKILRTTFKDIPNRRTFLNGQLITAPMAVLIGYAVRTLAAPHDDKITITYQERHKDVIAKAIERMKLDVKLYSTQGKLTLSVREGWFYEWLRDVIRVDPRERAIPSVILSANLDIVASFLDAYTADETQMGIDQLEYIWVLNIPNPTVRDALAFLLARTKTDTLYRDAYLGNGQYQLALKLIDMEPTYGDCIIDEVKAVLPAPSAPIMIDIDVNDNLYAVANGVVTHNSKYPQQAISIEGREAPLVRPLDEQTGKDMYSRLGKFLGAQYAPKSGTVAAVRQDRIDMVYDDGTKGSVYLYKNFPMNTKGYLNNIPQVKAGTHVDKDSLLASSNYTDDKGVGATGTNLRTGWISWKGGTYEDAIVLSESAAKKLTSTTMYSTDMDLDKTVTLGKKNYIAWKPGEYTKEQMSILDDDGIVKPGSIVQKGDPLVLAVRTTEPSPGTMGKRILTDISETWEHDHPGVITDIVKTRGGVKVLSTVTAPVEIGDKLSNMYGGKGVVSQVLPDDQMPQDKDGRPLEMLFSPLGLVSRCYDDQTEFLTRDGWKYGKDVQDTDELYCFNKDTWTWHWGKQLRPLWRAWYEGPMYSYKNDVTDFCVTEKHRVWAKTDYPGSSYSERFIEDIYGKRYYIPCVARREKQPIKTDFELPKLDGMYRYKNHTDDSRMVFEAHDWAAFLGWYLAEGNTDYYEDKYEYGVNIAQFDTVKPDNVAEIAALLDRLGFRWNYGKNNKQFHINGRRLAAYMKQFGYAWEKFIPDWLFEQPDDVISCFLDALWKGDGSITDSGRKTKDGRAVLSKRLALTSERLIDQVQMLYAMLGIPSTKHERTPERRACFKNVHKMWYLGVSTVPKQAQLVRHGWDKFNYTGMTYCPTVDTGYILTRRNGCIICMGNTNAGMLHEALLGKIAHKTGKPEVIPAFYNGDMYQYVTDKLKQAHLNADDDFYDPETGRKIPDVINGYSYVHKLKHLSESKMSGRGTDEYSSDETPGGSGYAKSKRYGMLEVSAMASSGAFDNLLDNKLIRGQSNADFWRSIRTGGIPTIPGEPLVQRKFFAHLQGAGVNVRKTPKGISVFALSNTDVNELAGPREVKSRDTYEAKNFRPIDGGLFGQDIFGLNGDRWGYIQLDEPVPNPVMAEPLARLLRITDKDFVAVASGQKEVDGMSNGLQMRDKLRGYDLDKESKAALQEFKNATPSKKDAALKRYVAVENMRRAGLNPAEYMLDRIPVLPPAFRPVSSHGGLTMVADANYLYAQIIDARDDFRDAKDLPKEYHDKARANLYTKWQELTGMYDPSDVKLKNKNVGGLLQWALGKGSPKFSGFQRKVLGNSVDTVGRGVIIPNSKLSIDQIGIPIKMAFDIMAPFVERGLVKRGYTPVDAMKAVKERSKQAFDVLQEVVATHPVIMNRAPTLHKYNLMAFQPVLVQGNTIQVNPSICPGQAADFDGDTIQNMVTTYVDTDKLDKKIKEVGKKHLTHLEYGVYSAYLLNQNRGDMRMVSKDTKGFFATATGTLSELPTVPGTEVVKSPTVTEWDVQDGFYTDTVDPVTGEHGLAQITKVSRHTGLTMFDCTLSVQGAFSHIATVSEDHSLITLNPETLELEKTRPADSLDRLVPRVIKNAGNNWDVCSRYVNIAKDIPATHDVGFIIGAILGDGWVDVNNCLRIACCNESLKKYFLELLQPGVLPLPLTKPAEAWAYAADDDRFSKNDAQRITIYADKEFKKELKKLIGSGAENKRIPEDCLMASRAHMTGILMGLLATDGTVSYAENTTAKKTPCKTVMIHTVSPYLRDGIQELCMRLGIRTGVTPYMGPHSTKTCYGVTIALTDLAKEARKHPEMYKIHHEDKDAALAKIILGVENSVSRKSTDIVPFPSVLRSEFIFAHVNAGEFKTVFPHAIDSGYIARATALKMVKLLKETVWPLYVEPKSVYARLRTHHTPAQAKELVDKWISIVENDEIAWEHVDSVTPATCTEGWDCTVPGPYTFTLSTGTVVQDTVNIHVPVSDNARKEAMAKMSPKANLITTANHKTMFKPEKEYMQGLYIATRMGKTPNGRAQIFRNLAEAREAYRKGVIDVDTPIQILDKQQ